MSREGVSKRTKRTKQAKCPVTLEAYLMDRIPATDATNKTERYGRYGQGEPEGSLSNTCLNPKAIKCQEKAINGEWEEVWKSVEKTLILQSINYQVIIKSVEMVEE